MAKTDWGLNDVVQPSDLNNIGQEINQLREDVDNMDFPLSDATDGTRSDVAASEKAVGLVMQEAQAAKQAGNERKQEVVDALIALGVTASTSDSWDTLISKMSAIIKATGNATAADVLSGKTFSNASGNDLTGSMPNRGAVNQTITTQNGQYTIPAGYHNGSGKITASFANLSAENIRNNVNIGGVVGSLKPSNSGSAFVDVATAYPLANGQVSDVPVLTLPAGISFISFFREAQNGSWLSYYTSPPRVGYLKLTNTNTGSFVSLNAFQHVNIRHFMIDIINGCYVFYDDTGAVINPMSNSQIKNLLNAPIKLSLYFYNTSGTTEIAAMAKLNGTIYYA